MKRAEKEIKELRRVNQLFKSRLQEKTKDPERKDIMIKDTASYKRSLSIKKQEHRRIKINQNSYDQSEEHEKRVRYYSFVALNLN